MSEQAFEYRVTRILEKNGFIVINCARSKPFDLIAAKKGIIYFVELKGKDTKFPEEQRQRQLDLSRKYLLNYAVIKQSKTHGKVNLTSYCYGEDLLYGTLKDIADVGA